MPGMPAHTWSTHASTLTCGLKAVMPRPALLGGISCFQLWHSQGIHTYLLSNTNPNRKTLTKCLSCPLTLGVLTCTLHQHKPGTRQQMAEQTKEPWTPTSSPECMPGANQPNSRMMVPKATSELSWLHPSETGASGHIPGEPLNPLVPANTL